MTEEKMIAAQVRMMNPDAQKYMDMYSKGIESLPDTSDLLALAAIPENQSNTELQLKCADSCTETMVAAMAFCENKDDQAGMAFCMLTSMHFPEEVAMYAAKKPNISGADAKKLEFLSKLISHPRQAAFTDDSEDGATEEYSISPWAYPIKIMYELAVRQGVSEKDIPNFVEKRVRKMWLISRKLKCKMH